MNHFTFIAFFGLCILTIANCENFPGDLILYDHFTHTYNGLTVGGSLLRSGSGKVVVNEAATIGRDIQLSASGVLNFEGKLSVGASVGIQLPQNTTTEERDLFENILLNLAGLNEFPTGFDTPGNPAASINIIEAVLTEPIETQFPTKSIPVKVRTNADEKAEDSVAVGTSRTFEFMSYETGEAKFHLGPDYHDPEEHTGILVEITGYGLSRLADATAKLGTFTSQYTTSSGTSDGGNAVHDQTANGTSSAQNGVTAATDDARNTMKIVYESLHKIGKTLAYEISHNHVMDHRYGARRSGHIMEFGPKPFATVTHN